MSGYAPWILFHVFILLMLGLDLGIVSRKARETTMREALAWCAVWMTLALVFNGGVYYYKGRDAALDFLTGYLVEQSLSVDNLFVFLLVFSYFKVPGALRHKVLFLGILGALVMRALFIYLGVTIIERFHWVTYLFGAFLVFTGIKLLRESGQEVNPDRNPVLRIFRRLMPVTENFEGEKFFVRRSAGLAATPLFIVLLVIETTDVVFAVDSIPAVLAVTRDPFIVYTSNVFAILGLRSLYFALAGLMGLFHYLHYGLAVILMFIGTKMLIAAWYHIPSWAALGFIALTLALSIGLSIWRLKRVDHKPLIDEPEPAEAE